MYVLPQMVTILGLLVFGDAGLKTLLYMYAGVRYERKNVNRKEVGQRDSTTSKIGNSIYA